MTVALLSIGTELLQGDVANTNGPWLAEQLTQLGFHVGTIETVADEHDALAASLTRLTESYPLLIATGGLGPTSDDITAEVAARVAGVELDTHEDVLATIKRRVEARGDSFRAGHEKQARLPIGAEQLNNGVGTAAGFILRRERGAYFFLPGVPDEMKAMYRSCVEPRIRNAASNNAYQVLLHCYGVGESWIAERLEGIDKAHPTVSFGFRSHSADITIKVFARGTDPAQAREHAEHAAREVRERLGDAIYADGDESLVHRAGRAVRARGWRLGLAESCTGGLIAQQLTASPASDFFVGGAVVYANAAKASLLGVSEDALRGHGAVSAEVAAEMAEGARRAFKCDVAASVTGIAGPTGASSDKPLGLCYWAVAHPGGTVVEQRVFSGNRNQVQHSASQAVLHLLRRTCAS